MSFLCSTSVTQPSKMLFDKMCTHRPLRAAASGTVSMQMTSTRSLLDDAEDLGGFGPPWVFWLVCSSDPKTTVVRRMGDPDGVQLGKRSTAKSAAQHHTAVEHVQDKSCIVLPASQICWCTRSMQVQSRCVACCVVGPTSYACACIRQLQV